MVVVQMDNEAIEEQLLAARLGTPAHRIVEAGDTS